MSTKTTAQGAKNGKVATVKKAVSEVKSILNPTANQRIKKLENFEKLASKYKKLEAKKDELESFNIAVDDLNEKMILKSGGATFEIGNSQVIAELKQVIEKKLSSLLQDAEKEIVNFQI